MAGPTKLGEWSHVVARRLGERDLLPDFGSRVYVLFIGMNLVRAAVTAYFVFWFSLSSSIRGGMAVLQLAVSGAVFSALTGLQAARYAARVDGALLFRETPSFSRFRKLLAKRFLVERPFSACGGALVAALGAIALVVQNDGDTLLSVLTVAAATCMLTYSIYRFAIPKIIGKDGFKVELSVALIAAFANPDLRNDGRAIAYTLFNMAIPPGLMENRPIFILLIYLCVALALLSFFLIKASADRLSAWMRGRRPTRIPVWAMPFRRAGVGLWMGVWLLAYIVYAFSGRRAAVLALATTGFAIVGSLAQVAAFLVSCAQRLGDDAKANFPLRIWASATILLALPPLLPCAILAFME